MDAIAIPTKPTRIRALRDVIAKSGTAVFLRGEEGYAKARTIWNGAVTHEPGLIARCRTVDEVRLSVIAAQAYDIPLSVRGGGYDWAGRALQDDGLVLDLSAMRQVTVDIVDKTARIGGGATAADISLAAGRYDLAAVTGSVGAVGMAGLLLGGGYGPLTTRFGLALDNLLGAEIVLADGQLVTADASQNADLFWALHGGGGNFGVVTSMELNLHPLGPLMAGLMLFPWSEASAVLRGYAEILSMAPDELSVTAGMIAAPDGSPAVFLGPVWSGEAEKGQKIMARLQSLGTPILCRVGSMNYGDLLNLHEAHLVHGRHHALRTHWLSHLTPEVIAAVIAAGKARSSPHSIIVLHHFHGAGTRVAPDATAFGLRQKHFLMEIMASWDPGENHCDIHHRWASKLSSAITPLALPGGYPNLLTAEDRDQIGAAYGGNASRLRDLKRKYDPENVFSSAIPIPN